MSEDLDGDNEPLEQECPTCGALCYSLGDGEYEAVTRDEDKRFAVAPIGDALAMREWLREELGGLGVLIDDEELDQFAEILAARYVERAPHRAGEP